ncbi:TonB-dependent receptor [Silvibacterium dinghuense]|uniref:TonB-dependent receptor n=1 Tax=Silvibacterium dinghuense TaxID=1560006 RepID=A0A4Q1S8W1_9BACT|nr:carboxypeptidase regulatory-like domain-containing protein [Silvibacterium dinghuense]RXS93424.1 TonB-dependent receptor [Silvibacterium dinghuense]GGH05703.1 hypothetical protein GCM10011586_22360 [Silvibacterium dinghuense]
MRFKSGSHWLLSALLLLLSSLTLHAQVDTGSLSGIVTDPAGAVVANATVTVTNTGTSAAHTVSTSNNGAFHLENLEPAVYTVSVELAGFETWRARVEVTVGGHAALNAKLAVGSNKSTVEVVALGGVEVDTSSQEVSEIVTPEQVKQLPSLTRNIYDFVGLSGNVSQGDEAQGHTQNSTNLGVGYSINGQRSSGTEILLDGVENIELFDDVVGLHVPVDSVGEYRVLTSNFDPQYGRASGGVVSVVTASGSNQFHGTFSEFNRVAAYTANTVTNAQGGLSKGGYTRNQPSFFLSGPIVRNKLFFAAGAEWLRVRSNTIQTAWVPTSDLLSYAATTTQNFVSKYGQSFTYAQTITNSAAGTPFASVPASTPVFGLVNYSVPQDAGGGLPQNTYNYVLRGDYQYSDRTQYFGRFVGWKLDEPLGALYYSPYSNYDAGELDKDYAALGGFTHVFSPTLVTSGRVSFSRINLNENTTEAGLTTPALYFSSAAQVNGYSVDLPGNGLGLPFGGPQNVLQWNQDVDWNRGNHNFKFGSQLLYIQANRTFGAYAQAEEALAGSVEGDSTGYAGFLSGTVGTFSTAVDPQGHFPGQTISTPLTQPNFARSDRFHDWAVYGQDAWRATPKLTVNYGVRYEYFGVQHNNKADLDSNFYYGSGSSYADQIRSGQVFTVPNSPIHELWEPSYGTVSPRLGFAFDPTGSGKTAVRGGWGISYERNFGNVTFNVIQNPPNYAVVVQNGVAVSTSNLGTLADADGEVTLPSTSLRHVAQNIRTAQTQFWNLTVEHQIAPQTVVSATYLGARGLHLYDIKNINGEGSGNYLAGDDYATDGLTRLNSTYSNINSRGSNGDSYYEAVNLRFSTRNLLTSGLSATANYTYGHAIDDLSSTFSETNAGGGGYNLGYTNPFDPGYDRGSSDLDIRQRFVFAPIYETPWFHNSKSLKGELLGNWTATGIYTVRSGTSFTYYDSTYNLGDYYNIARYVPSSSIKKWKYTKSQGEVPGAVNQYYLASSLPTGQKIVNDAIGGYSNWAFPTYAPERNSFVGPGAWNLDLAVSKQFPVWEKVNVELRAEGFDVLNHHNLYVQETLADAANYYPSTPVITAKKGGVNGSASEERRFGQLAVKVNF